MRTTQTVQFPLSKASEAKVRKYYKSSSNIRKNANEESVFRSLGIYNKKNAYNAMGDLYNIYVNSENKKIIDSRNVAKNAVKKAKKEATKIAKKKRIVVKDANKQFTFIIHLELETTYKQDFYEHGEKKKYSRDDVVVRKETTSPETDLKKNIPAIIKGKFFEDSYKIVVVLHSRVEFMNTDKLIKDRKIKIKQPMRRSYVLRNDWLKYSSGIANSAYEETEDRCVYNQLTKYLLNPPTGNPSKFVGGRRTSEESLFMFFKETINENNLYDDYPDFSMDSGVSSQLIKFLCTHLKRNMYAFDETQKLFHTLTTNTSENYSPIVFYKLHGHCYLINDPSVIKSVATINALKGNKIITSTIEQIKEETNMEVFNLEKYNVSQSKEMIEGIYLVNQSNLDDEITEFISTFDSIPRTKSKKSNVVEIKFEVGLVTREENKKYVIICIDATFADNFTYEQVKKVAEYSDIKYVNEGIGSLIMSILEKGGKSCREVLSATDRKTLIETYGNMCNICKIPCESYEIDHITPIASGGDNNTKNLQPLCNTCHKKKTTDENKSGAYKVKDIETSIFNKVVLDNIVNKNEWKAWAFVERVPYESNEQTDNLETYKYDMIKCRRNIAYYSKYEFPVYSVMDIPTPFTGTLQCGMYYVNTMSVFPFRGCGWYSQPIVEYGILTNIITLQDIKMEFLPSAKLPASHFQKSIDILLKAFEVELPLQKLSINSLIGLFGKTKRSSSKTLFSLSNHVAAEWWGDKDPKCEVFIKNITLNNGRVIYKGIFSEQVDVEGMKYCLYKQILEMEAVELHKLETIIINKGGIILDRNTDAIRYARKNAIEIVEYWDDDNTELKYQKEGAKPLTCQMLPHMRREQEIDLTVFDLQWNIQEDYKTAEEEAKRIIDNNKSIHIDGRAGTGKTYLVNKVIDELKSRGKTFLGFSPTNKGARLIGGKTIHSLYYKFKSYKRALFDIMEKVDYVFIDEVSMMTKDFYQLFLLIKRYFPQMKFIIAGDFGQLPPVKDNWTGDYENSPAMHGLCDGNRIKLIKCRRADRELFELCRSVESIDMSKFTPTEDTYLNLAYTHETRMKINRQCMNRFLGDEKGTFIAKDPKNPKTQNVMLTKGMPIIAHTTDKKLNILKSQTFTLTHVCGKFFTIINEDVTMNFKLENFNKFFYLGFCITIHSSQGETFNEKYTIHDWNFSRFCPKAKYVAMSRGTNINNIQIA